ncbi:hypothetical protein [Gilvimarinus algae]|uniref:Transcriptional regulator SutA RNAP-binding domain-containing protein n=1 Tax=Gilvimarinus algae TaxID=3058037 RepID=A0ABT8TK78_9GAMM|nr:hypothetical protein [Gilvimarinus sp. SDUM040014]MDO3383051.1 hypothetical protein [Gilvimarinus sp. SDUM040014]
MASQYELDEDRDLDQDDDIEVSDEEVSAADDSKAQPLEDFSIASREKLRTELSQQIEAYLARGGKINEVPNRAASDRPSKPASEYTGSLM